MESDHDKFVTEKALYSEEILRVLSKKLAV